METRTKTEKEELLDKKIEELRKKNEARVKKFQEAEEDRKRAEEAGCAVTLKRSTSPIENDSFPSLQQERQQHRRQKRLDRPPFQAKPRAKKYVPGTSEEWQQYIAEKNKNNSQNDNGSDERNSNNNNSNNNNNNTNYQRKERTPKYQGREIYTPKQLELDGDQVKPPPDPKNAFLADSYRDPSSVPKPAAVASSVPKSAAVAEATITTTTAITAPTTLAKNKSEKEILKILGIDTIEATPEKQPHPSPPQPAAATAPKFQGDARERINQLRALRGQHFTDLTDSKDQAPPSRETSNRQHRPIGKKQRPEMSKLQKVPSVNATSSTEATEKPLKSILKKPKPVVNETQCCDDSHPIIAVITTPGDDDDDDKGDESESLGYNRNKEKAICDWLEKTENPEINTAGSDDDEWEDVDEDDESNSSFALDTSKAVDTTTAMAKAAPPVPDDNDDLDSIEEDKAAFQEFIEQHTLTLDQANAFNWGTEMERISMENKKKMEEAEVDE